MGNEQSETQDEENPIINPPDLNSSEPIFNFGKNEIEKSKKDQVQFSRRKEQRKTISASNSLHLKQIQNLGEEQKKIGKSLFSKQSKEKISFDPNIKENKSNKEKSTFQRRNNRSISLVQKKKLGSQIFKDELKIKVSINNLVNEIQGLPTMKYKVTNKIGEGSYGAVYLAFNIYTKQKVAIKRIVKNEENKIDELELINEINILKKLSHPNILKIIEFYQSEHSYYIITDHCSNGELYDQIKYKYNENQLAVLFYQMFSGIAYLHDKNIVHRDLKLENILISEIEVDKKTNDRFFWIKIIDFGTAKIFEKNKKEKSVVGSSYYIAPEVLKKSYNEKCDTWSIGVILYMLIVGRAPFDGVDDDEIISNIKKGKYNSNHKKLIESSKEVQDLVKKLLLVDSKKRLSAIDALKHPWFKKFKAKCIYSNISDKKIKNYLDRLRHYQINSKFQQMVWLFIVHNVPDTNETKDILKMFRLFNDNDDGKMSKDELYNALIKYFDKSDIDKEIDDLFFLLDGSNKCYIEYEEFLGACMDKNKLLCEEHLTYAFNYFDKSNKGKISFDNIKIYFVDEKTNEDVFRNIFDEIDTNKDGEIDYSEFKNMMFGY